MTNMFRAICKLGIVASCLVAIVFRAQTLAAVDEKPAISLETIIEKWQARSDR